MMRLSAIHSGVLRYIVERGYCPGDKLPTLEQVSAELGVSVAKAREELGVARALGAVEVKPGSGIRVEPYRFAPAASLSALYAIGQDGWRFDRLRDVRNALELAFWDQAVGALTPVDVASLGNLIDAARRRLAQTPIQIPTREHRLFHLTIFSRLDNPFVTGLLEAYWDAYEAFGMDLYADLAYHRGVWEYHERMVESITAGDADSGRRLLLDHMKLLRHHEPAEAVEPDRSAHPRFE
jgi:DNA-binding FadR family transcriptional regulator